MSIDLTDLLEKPKNDFIFQTFNSNKHLIQEIQLKITIKVKNYEVNLKIESDSI